LRERFEEKMMQSGVRLCRAFARFHNDAKRACQCLCGGKNSKRGEGKKKKKKKKKNLKSVEKKKSAKLPSEPILHWSEKY
jgi:hypothetical protein